MLAQMPTTRWHQDQNVRLRTVQSSRDWLVSQLAGDMWKPMLETMHNINDGDLYATAGMFMNFDSIGIRQVIDDTEIAADRVAAAEFMKLHLVAVRLRVIRLLPYLRGFPRRMALVLGSNAQADLTLSTLKQDHENFIEMGQSPLAFVKKMASRSTHNKMCVLQMYEVAKDRQFISSYYLIKVGVTNQGAYDTRARSS